MYEQLGKCELKDGEKVEIGLVQGPDLDWAERLEQLLVHKGPMWNWQNAEMLRRELGIEARFYILHRDGDPFANITTATYRGAGHFGHVWTRPEDRRKGACSRLMEVQMQHFRQAGGRALFLGTGFESPPYRIYEAHGFTGVEEQSGNMEYYAGSQAEFAAEYFAAGAARIEAVGWQHWPASAALFLGDFPGVVRCAPLGLFGRNSTEGLFLGLIRGEIDHRQEGEAPRARVLVQPDTGAVLGLALWAWDGLWPKTALVDLYCHPAWWVRGGELLESLELPQCERCLAYTDEGAQEKKSILSAAGFRQTGRYPRRVAADRARRQLVDIVSWEQ